ncbi:MAG TPA: basic secretory protein-like protein, partial [Verrucomicrobiae bacterium]|nr:basic secretory protein-like protein [Verrucomicrobiae bacterium]
MGRNFWKPVKIRRWKFFTMRADSGIFGVTMIKRLVILSGLLAAGRLLAGDLAENYAPLGRLIVTNFASAPFPHPLRAQGHSYRDQFFSGAEHYQDSHVALFIPKDFKPGRTIDFVVHFHGWGNNVSNALGKYQLPEQFAASHRNAILIVPQGPLDASDSFGGKLEDAEGFKRFMAEGMEVLKQHGIVAKGGIGHLILSGHSGGYEVISAILAGGGLTGKISEVWLFDALYAKTERFALWFDHHPGRFIDLYTEHGGTKDETEALIAALQGNSVPYFSADETNATAVDLRSHHLIFLFSELPHDEVMQERETFRQFLETSFLETTGTKSVRSVDVRDAPEAQALAERARQIGNDVYPQIRALLDDGKSYLPRQFDIIFREHLGPPKSDGENEPSGVACRETVFLNAGWFIDHPEALEHVMIHEMAHVAQNYPHFAYRHVWQWCAHYLAFTAAHPFRSYPPAEPTYWTEGIADYVFARLAGHTNPTNCPECDERFPDYKTGYACAASFLLYIDATYGANFTCQLNTALRRGTFSDQFFANATGKSLDALWDDFQKTRAYTPVAADYNEFDQSLGNTNGKPAVDFETRLDKYYAKHPDIKEYMAALDPSHTWPPEGVQDDIKDFLYIRHQPDGEKTLLGAEAEVRELHRALGYVKGKPPEDLRPRLVAYLEAHPDMKELVARLGWLDGKLSPKIRDWIESLILGRIQPGAKATMEAEAF